MQTDSIRTPFLSVTSASPDEKGATTLEVAISITVFLILLIFIVDLAQAGFRMLTARFIASRAVRVVTTGEPLQEGDPATSTPAVDCQSLRVNKIRDFIRGQAAAFNMPTIPNDKIQLCVINGSCAGGTIDDPGGPRDYVLVRVRVPIKIFTFRLVSALFGGAISSDLEIRSEALGKNEPFLEPDRSC